MPAKGQSLSATAVRSMKISKQKRIARKYNWELAEDYLDVVLHRAKNRQLKFITLREFKDKISKGESIKDIKKQGVCKHLLQFYSNFLQNKIQIDKETFIKEYTGGLTLFEIAEKYNITKDDITYVRQLYQQKRTGYTYQERKRKEVPLTDIQKAIIYGSLLGDAKKTSSEYTTSVCFKHSEKHSKNGLKAKKSLRTT
jgi:predicted DNA-binding protein YlxM (UPF0122 family)